tara:strand:- start:163 stop:543 length:381 start_codon:yes stop_codon:yes gene_type:complete
MDFFDSFPAMERQDLRDLKKGIDSSFRDFSRAYGDEIEGFFEPLLQFFSLVRKVAGKCALASSYYWLGDIGVAWITELEACHRNSNSFSRYWLFWDVEGYNGNPRYNIGCHITVYCGWYSLWNMDG